MSNKLYNDNFKLHISVSMEDAIEELYKESGEDWEQSNEFIKYIFESDELPSRKFFRRRKNG